MKPFLILCVATLLASPALLAAGPKLELKEGDRVAFIGNTFVEREQVDCYIETALTSRYPDRNITFRNLGYSADTVTGEARGLCTGWSQFEAPDKAFERLRKLVAEYKPTVLLINYGMTESFFGPEKLPEFTANYSKMLDALSMAAGTSPRIVLVSPNYHEDLGLALPDPTDHNKNLKLYSDAIAGIAASRAAAFIDLFAMTKEMSGPAKITTNGIHLSPIGYWVVAYLMIDSAAQNPRGWRVTLSPTGKVQEEKMGRVSDALAKEGRLTFTLQAEYLPPAPLAGSHSNEPGRDLLSITDLPPGRYQLKAGDAVIATDTSQAWAHGVTVNRAVEARQAEALRKMIVAKNFDFFNYQRPDNDSYILAFRKREQGKNAVELPQFLPLVEEKEKQIAILRVPKPVTYTLEPVK